MTEARTNREVYSYEEKHVRLGQRSDERVNCNSSVTHLYN